jgi:poly(hydroxyalkanoate) depolymerase family esterase
MSKRNGLAKLAELRRRLLTLVRGQGVTLDEPVRPPRTERLQEITGFGSNPGNARMFVYVPERTARKPALVVALHGCTQSAASYDRGSGWSTLADEAGFVVVYPEQQRSNNPQGCFSWFVPGDTARDCGEALSIRQMVDHAIRAFGVDKRRVFVTGLSAGGAMASAMLATYPDVFSGGAIIAGLPYGCATTAEEAFAAMFGNRTGAQDASGDRIRKASQYRGPWPRISIWHGSADPIVKASNAEDIIRQWADVHAISPTPTHEEFVRGHSRRVWHDADGDTVIEAYTITGMVHGVPIATGKDVEGYGTPGPFFFDVGISSTYHIAGFWGLTKVREKARSPAAENASERAELGNRAIVPAAISAAGRYAAEPLDTVESRNESRDRSLPLDPNVAIAAAFKAAGFPVPEHGGDAAPSQASHPAQQFAPGPIIAAALKAAGLLKP